MCDFSMQTYGIKNIISCVTILLLNRVALDCAPDDDENHNNQRDCPDKPAVWVDDAEHEFIVT